MEVPKKRSSGVSGSKSAIRLTIVLRFHQKWRPAAALNPASAQSISQGRFASSRIVGAIVRKTRTSIAGRKTVRNPIVSVMTKTVL